VASNRYRSNRSLGNKINNIDGRLGDAQKDTANPHMSPDFIVSDFLSTDSVTTKALALRSATELQVGRGSIGTEHLGVINQIITDSGVVFRGTPGNLVVAVRGAENQTANLMEWQDHLGYALAGVSSQGAIFGYELEVDNIFAGNISVDTFTGNIMQITQIDDISALFDGVEDRFPLTYQGEPLQVNNPFRLLIYVDGIIQDIYTPEYVWQSPFERKGAFVDSDGYIHFSTIPPAGAVFSGRLMPGQDTTTQTTNYPYRPIDIMLGA
jgi:hypothetical protein